MPKKRQRVTDLEKQYKKERKRIQQFIRRTEKRGYQIPENILPKKPKRITKKSVERLKKITPAKIYQKSKYQPDLSQKAISGTEARKAERKKSAQKGVQTKKQNKQRYESAQEQALQKIHEYQKSTEAKQGFLLPKQALIEWEQMIQEGKISYEGLLDISSDKLLESNLAKYKDPWTGTVFTGKEGLEIERHRKEFAEAHSIINSDEISQTDYILREVENIINDWTPSVHWTDWFAKVKEKDKNLLKRVLEGAIENEGRDAVARRVRDHADEIEELTNKIVRVSGGKGQDARSEINGAVARFRAIIYGRPSSKEELDELNEWIETSELEETFT